MQRREMETQADRLGVPWTHTTTDAELLSLINSRMRGVSMSNGAQETVQQESAEAQVPEEQDQCHGLFWDFPKAVECKQCSGQHSCFQKFTKSTFPEMVEVLGPTATLEQLAKALDVSQEAVLVAKNEQVKTALPAPPVEPVPDPEQAVFDYAGESLEMTEIPDEPESLEKAEEAAPELDLADANELVDELEAESELEPPPPAETEMPKKKMASKKAPTGKKKAPTKKTKVVSKKAASKKAPTGKKKKVAAKKPPTAAPSEVPDPPSAESVKTASDSVKSKAHASNAVRAKGQAGPAKGRRNGGLVDDPWGKHTWVRRWRQERKHPLIKKLRPGMKLKREYQGVIHEVTVLKKFYRYQQQDFPTLYMVVKEITGTKPAPRQLTMDGRRPSGTRDLCQWSAPRFFALRALFNKI